MSNSRTNGTIGITNATGYFQLDFTFLGKSGPLRGSLANLLERSLDIFVLTSKSCGKKNGTLSLSLVDDQAMRYANHFLRGKLGTTDVLSIEYPADDLSGTFDAELIISLETAEKQARMRRLFVLDEVSMLVVHGLLHVAGYDHKNSIERREMKNKEREILENLNLGFKSGLIN